MCIVKHSFVPLLAGLLIIFSVFQVKSVCALRNSEYKFNPRIPVISFISLFSTILLLSMYSFGHAFLYDYFLWGFISIRFHFLFFFLDIEWISVVRLSFGQVLGLHTPYMDDENKAIQHWSLTSKSLYIIPVSTHI